MRAAHPRNQRRCVHRANVWRAYNDRSRRTWHPTPSAADNDPPAIVEGSKTPWLVVNPRPAPGRDPNPVAVAIGSPAGDTRTREPDRAIPLHGAPATVIIQVFVTNGLRGDIARGFRVIFATVATRTPMIEIILISIVALDATIQLIGASKGADLIRMHGESLAAAGHLTCER